MKKTTVIAALGLVLSAAACTTEDPTPPGEIIEGAASTDRVGDVAEQSAGRGSGDSAQESGDSAQESAPPDEGAQTAAPEAGAEPVCAELFEGDSPLTARLEAGRGLLVLGEPLDESQVEEITTLRDSLSSLATDGTGEKSRAIEQLNEPFVQAVEAVESGEGQEPEGGEIVLPKLDVSGSVAAQDQLQGACAG